MKKLILLLATFFCLTANAQQSDSLIIAKIINQSLTNSECYPRLKYLCKNIGPRLSGSLNGEKAVEYVYQLCIDQKLDTTYLQPVTVPHWVRGQKEQAHYKVNGKKTDVAICALGGSIATSKKGICAPVIEVHDFEEIKKLGREKIEGKIVFMNHPMKDSYVHTFDAYGEAAKYRWGTAQNAAQYGAVGVVVRSMTLALDNNPHTGAMGYNDTIIKIPACAISTMVAEELSKAIKSNLEVQFYFKQSCEVFPDAQSYNVIGELKGSEKPEEIIVIGGHLDSWELGEGAHDDGAGIMQSLEVLRIFQNLNMKPKRTIRFVAFANEENGSRGGKQLLVLAKERNEKIIAAIESDEGGFTPRGFSFNGDSLKMQHVMSKQELFYPYELKYWEEGYGGTDINYLKEVGALLIGFVPDSQRYFDVHHAATDVLENVNKRELELGAGSMAALVYVLSEYGVNP
jgi:carboxypeptidase Q